MPTWLTAFSIDHLPFPMSLELLLIAGRAAALVGAFCVFAWAFSRWRRAQARDAQRVFEQLDLIQGELHGLAETVTALGTRLDELHDKITSQAQLAPASAASGQRGYENAIRLAQRGANSNDIATQCGLARHEADLLVRLHGRTETESRPTAQDSPVVTAMPATRKRLSVVG